MVAERRLIGEDLYICGPCLRMSDGSCPRTDAVNPDGLDRDSLLASSSDSEKRILFDCFLQVCEELAYHTCEAHRLLSYVVEGNERFSLWRKVRLEVVIFQQVSQPLQCALELRLVELEQLSLVSSESREEPMRVGPLQEPSAVSDLSHALGQEAEIMDFEVVHLRQQCCQIPHACCVRCGRVLLCPLMSQEAFVEVRETPQLTLVSRLVLSLIFFKGVASLMSFPVLHADPTEFVAASPRLSARHVHASSILFNGLRALGAELGVQQDPKGVAAIVAALLHPGGHRLTEHGEMPISPTLETPHSGARA